MLEPTESPSVLGSLLMRHKAGDPKVANEILTHCQGRFERFAEAMLGRSGKQGDVEPDELVNELVTRLIPVLREKTFDTSAEFLCYAATVIRNHLLDLAKKRKPQLVSGPDSDSSAPDLLRDIPETTDDPEKLAKWGEIHAIIAQLPADERQLFDLIFYQDLKVPEVSELLGIAETTLRTKWNNTKIHFMRLYGNNGSF